MSFCNKCGAQLPDGVKFCPACGAPAAQQPQNTDTTQFFAAPSEASDFTSQVDPQDAQQNKLMAILSYFGILVVVPIIGAKESRFAQFHANQGVILLILEVAFSFVLRILNSILRAISPSLTIVTSLLSLVYVAIFVLAVIGIVNAAKGRAKELPVIGKIRILK